MTDSLFDTIHPRDVRELYAKQPERPKAVTAFLGRLAMLHGVPVAYLLPHAKLLPPNSLKLFRIDAQWINALIGGALSVGRGNTVRILLDDAMSGVFGSDLLQEARRKSAERRGLPKPVGPARGKDLKPTDAFSGFVLRSGVLSGWPGAEVRSYRSGGGEELAILRLDRLAGDTLLGIVDGLVGAIEIIQPPEGVHFKISEDAGLYRNKETGVLDIATLASPNKGSAAFAADTLAKSVRLRFEIGG